MAAQSYPVELTAPDIEPYRKGNTGIEFVTSFDSGKPGPHVMINAITHGNEICGAIALDTLFKLGLRPSRGILTFGFINHMAYARFDAANPDASRFVDEDFNRVWVENRLDSDEDTVELRRARELRPLFDTVDLMLDIHSLGTYSKPLMICHGLKKERDFAAKVNFPAHIMCGSGHIVGKRIIEYTPFNDAANDKVALLVECGQHWAASSGRVALDTALHFLRVADVVDPAFIDAHLSAEGKNPPKAEMWEVTGGITAKTDDFRFAEQYIGMEVIAKAGTPIAQDGGETIVTPHDDCLLMMPSYKQGAGTRKLRLCKRIG
ncbi:MAG: succinylglutamate desuccinylase/aspartoacylase family protein [Alphaproteobacteria bacterium]|nr:succinylglutamate desuccinylase/aspartoacylase family protein [Alphaproteobacteria bacterium]MBU0798743.1 succinylglutamate desuccinylase/aspartoacylase family protein [Alphaproteobacteria bacterium]MBU0886006.1 succinylglutamate desuccinylase/aspartoacylase family protein [Alphaproteobacteria bacterium]MBU1811995.1 succinylglutamate desuccinylase/aspartoacylase family protein [Alphaproteobacteria bacterium]MBU2092220.1 succinylglutamate desuccinylase/aspartoacylase family protein [Alphaprot